MLDPYNLDPPKRKKLKDDEAIWVTATFVPNHILAEEIKQLKKDSKELEVRIKKFLKEEKWLKKMVALAVKGKVKKVEKALEKL